VCANTAPLAIPEVSLRSVDRIETDAETLIQRSLPAAVARRTIPLTQ
jgi:hypothetical protein